jgi:large subunit ribosomal protein L9
MDIILLEKVRNLGGLGDQVKVRAGYGRNYLIPKGKAVIANAGNKAKFEAQRAELEMTQAEAFNQAKARAEAMAGVTVQIMAKAGDEGKLFGSIGTADIAEAVTRMGFPLERAELHLPQGPLKTLGDHAVPVSLHSEVNFDIIVSIVAEA